MRIGHSVISYLAVAATYLQHKTEKLQLGTKETDSISNSKHKKLSPLHDTFAPQPCHNFEVKYVNWNREETMILPAGWEPFGGFASSWPKSGLFLRKCTDQIDSKEP